MHNKLSPLAYSHYMQSDEWASLRAASGWDTLKLELETGVVKAYRKKTPAGGLLYIPGFMPAKPEQLTEVISKLKNGKNLICKIEPCEPENKEAAQWFKDAGWKPARSVQYEFTVRLDLTQHENDLWMGMKSRGRQEINYARRDGVKIDEVEPTSDNLDFMYKILQDTSRRKSFGIREKRATVNFWVSFRDANQLKLFFAKHKDKIISGAVFISDGGNKVWYKDAGSLPAHAKLFGPRLLLWEAALKFKEAGYKIFDLGGTPGPDNYESSPMKGVYIFKTAFTREVTPMMPAFELPLKPIVYPIWRVIEPAALKSRRLLSKLKGKLLRR